MAWGDQASKRASDCRITNYTTATSTIRRLSSRAELQELNRIAAVEVVLNSPFKDIRCRLCCLQYRCFISLVDKVAVVPPSPSPSRDLIETELFFLAL